MSSERNRPARAELRDPPKRVRNAAYERCRDPGSRQQNPVLHLNGGPCDLFSSARTLVARPPGTPGRIRLDACRGDSFEGVWREHTDAARWNEIQGMGRGPDRYRNLVQWYGMPY